MASSYVSSMDLRDLKLLYVCTDFPYPPVSGGLVDMWNRIQALHSLGVTVDLIVTAGVAPSPQDLERVTRCVRRLMIAHRLRGVHGLFSFRPGQAVIRKALRQVELVEDYDVVLMQTEFASEILHNKTLKARTKVVRVDNDEYTYYLQTAKAERSWLLKIYYLQEALRVRALSARVLPAMDMLWFVSFDELERYRDGRPLHNQVLSFVPSGIDLSLSDTPPLTGSQVLFVGNLWATLNRQAVEWYISNVHPRLSEVPGYHFVIAGSTRGRGCSWLDETIRAYSNIVAHYDSEDLTPFYKSSAAFVNPMQSGAGVKLKTIEAVLRGLPVISTTTGAEGSGLTKESQYRCADTPEKFAEQVRKILRDKEIAHKMVADAQSFILDQYDQRKVLGRLLVQAACRDGLRKPPDAAASTPEPL